MEILWDEVVPDPPFPPAQPGEKETHTKKIPAKMENSKIVREFFIGKQREIKIICAGKRGGWSPGAAGLP